MNKSGEDILSLPERHSSYLRCFSRTAPIVAQLAELFRFRRCLSQDLSYIRTTEKLYRTHGSVILISPYISDRHQ